MASKKNATKQTLSPTLVKVFNQAKESALDSLKILESLEKETKSQIMAAAQAAVNTLKIPNSEERRKMTNDKIVASLKKIGLATQEQVETLEARIAQLESKLAARTSSARSSAAREAGATSTSANTETSTNTPTA